MPLDLRIEELKGGDTSVFNGRKLIALFYGDEDDETKTGLEEAQIFVNAMEKHHGNV